MVVLEFVNVPLISDNFGSLYQEYVGNVSLLIEFRKFIFVSNKFILEKLKLNFVVLFVYIVLAVLLDMIIFLWLFELNYDKVVNLVVDIELDNKSTVTYVYSLDCNSKLKVQQILNPNRVSLFIK